MSLFACAARYRGTVFRSAAQAEGSTQRGVPGQAIRGTDLGVEHGRYLRGELGGSPGLERDVGAEKLERVGQPVFVQVEQMPLRCDPVRVIPFGTDRTS